MNTRLLCHVFALFVASSSFARAQGPAARPGKIVGPIVGVGRGQPLTPEQEAEERRQQIKTLLEQFSGDDENTRYFAAGQLARMGKQALPQVQEAAEAKGLNDEAKKRFTVLIATMKADSGRRSAMEKYLKEKGIERGEISPIMDEALQKDFPDHVFYVLRFRQFPVAYEVPAGMKPSNVFVVQAGGAVEPLPDLAALTKFFQKSLQAVQDVPAGETAARAWLRLTQEWRQDGFYRFIIPADAITVDSTVDKGLKVAAKAVVTGGGNRGEVATTLTFSSIGKLTAATDEGQVREGVRPICQATKLLDADPIVRGMARQSILVMGVAAWDYLIEQRAKASPELQVEIDRIWRQVLEEKR